MTGFDKCHFCCAAQSGTGVMWIENGWPVYQCSRCFREHLKNARPITPEAPECKTEGVPHES